MNLVKKVSNERAAQLVEKAEREQMVLKEKQYYDVLWEQDRQKKIQREEKDRLHRHELNQKMIQMLEEQMNLLRSHAHFETELKQQEAELMVILI